MKCSNCRLNITSLVCGRCGWANTEIVVEKVVEVEPSLIEATPEPSTEAHEDPQVIEEQVPSLAGHLF